MNSVTEDILMHYGMPRRSGRYPWGSGDDPYQRTEDFLARVEEMRKNNYTYTDEKGRTYTGDTAIAKKLRLTTGEFRTELDIANHERKMLKVARAKSLREDGLGYTAIGREMGVNESTVRGWLEPKREDRLYKAQKTADFLKKQVDEKGMIDVGKGTDLELNVSKERLREALHLLKREGYEVYTGGVAQPTNPGQQTIQKVLCVPGTKHSEIYDYSRVHTINEYTSRDGGETFEKFVYPKSMDSKRIQVCYKEDGGELKDGIVELRRGVKDLSLGNAHYSQVRILVDGTHYIKGMAVYSDDMPPGVDLIFNTNKPKGTPMCGEDKGNTVLKKIKKEDPDNPFGSLISPKGQSKYIDENGVEQLSLINKRANEGDWSEWKDALPSQFLSKQSKFMIKKQLGLAKADKMAEFEEICELENPTIKKHLLREFADNCDAAAVNLQAAALPGQKYHVIIPVNSLRDDEVYAPQYENGTKLALIRYPHGGTFEIPILTVNNKNDLAKKLMGEKAGDAIGITKKNADQLSGADFDGDTVMAIPTHDKEGKVKISARDQLEGLKGFDPKEAYPEVPGMKRMTDTQKQMGVISNLITDMTLLGASDDKLARAVRHSMVVIDAEKHGLNYRQSEIDNDIASLVREFQVNVRPDGSVHYGGAATIISRAKGQESVLKRQGTPYVNMKDSPDYDPSRPEGALIYKTADDANLYKPKYTVNKNTGVRTYTTTTGEKIKFNPDDKEAAAKYRPIKKVDPKTGEVTYTNKDGTITYKLETRTQKSTRMAETDDAYSLVSEARNAKELLYADYANSMKNLANQARKEMMTTIDIEVNSTAKKTYAAEIESLDNKLRDAEINKGRERAAARATNAEVSSKIKSYKEATGEKMDKGDIKKMNQQALKKYREELGSVSRKDRNIDITDREWEAIQAGAVSKSKLTRILNNTDVDKLRERATPRNTTKLSQTKINKLKSMSANPNYSLSDIAQALGCSTSTVSKYLKGVNE